LIAAAPVVQKEIRFISLGPELPYLGKSLGFNLKEDFYENVSFAISTNFMVYRDLWK
jgi:hypothetical protein